MNNFEDIVSRNNGRLSIKDLVGYKKIGEGSDGSIFQLTPEKCIKVFKGEEAFRNELFAYRQENRLQLFRRSMSMVKTIL